MNKGQLILLIKSLANDIAISNGCSLESILMKHGCGAIDLLELECDHMALIFKDFSDDTYYYSYRNNTCYRHEIGDVSLITQTEISKDLYHTLMQHVS